MGEFDFKFWVRVSDRRVASSKKQCFQMSVVKWSELHLTSENFSLGQRRLMGVHSFHCPTGKYLLNVKFNKGQLVLVAQKGLNDGKVEWK